MSDENKSESPRPTDNELVAVIANEYGVSMETAWGWLDDFGQEVAA